MLSSKELIGKMSIEEKAEILTGYEGTTHGFENLGIEAVRMVDGPCGVRKTETNTPGGCVSFPTPSAVGASWNKELAFRFGQALAKECIQEGYEMLLGPGVNMKRTPYCGRNFEYFSEDPVLSGLIGAGIINGLDSMGVAQSLKHFAMNNQEYERNTINAEVDERTMREYYLKVFQIVLENSNPTSIMCAYNKVNGIWCSENRYLLTQILRDEWKYDGMVISDWGAVHNSVKAIKAGLDLDMPCNKNIANEVRAALDSGKLSENELDSAVTHMLDFIGKIKTTKRAEIEYSRDEQHDFARELAGESIVLLKNEDNVLPINGKKYRKIGVFGRAAEIPTISGAGSSRVLVDENLIEKPIDFIRKEAEKENIEVYYSPVSATTFENNYMGAEDVGELNDMANEDNGFDAMLVFVGNNYGLDVETEYWDRENLTFTNYLNGMIESACNACDNVIVVMQTGSASIPGRWHNKVKGIIQMWYSGESGGGAVADIIFGRVNPSAKLSESFCITDRKDMDITGDGKKTWYDEGMFVGYRYYDKHPNELWYPFGHGLSYTKFEYSSLSLSKPIGIDDNVDVTVTLNVKNVGDMDGKEIVQLYVAHTDSVVLKPEKELRNFEKVYLKAGEEKKISFKLSKKDFEYYNVCLHDWHIESGVYKIIAAASAADIRAEAEYRIENSNDYSKNEISTQFVMQQA